MDSLTQYTKQPHSYSEQIQILVDRGLVVTNKELAEKRLVYYNYYRFQGYVVPFELCRDRFIPNTTFNQIQELYEYDVNLRKLILDAISTIEIYTRTQIAYELSISTQNAFPHLDKSLFKDEGKWEKLRFKFQEETNRSKEQFLKHYQEKYCEFPKVPIWIQTELSTFHTLSFMFENLAQKYQTIIAKNFGVHSVVLCSWLHVLCTLRNCCAHYSRLWNRDYSISPKIPYNLPEFDLYNRLEKDTKCIGTKKIFCLLSIVCFILKKIYERTGIELNWQKRITELLLSPPSVPKFKEHIGFVNDWECSLLWKSN